MAQLPGILTRSEADFIIMDYKLDRFQIEAHVPGQENFVAIESKKFHSPKNIYLDHDQNDRATKNFFKSQINRLLGEKEKAKRQFYSCH